jgi:hypothetical protein
VITNIATNRNDIKAQIIRRHGADVAAILLPAELAKRAAEDDSCAAINAELDSINQELANIASRSEARFAALQARMDLACAARRTIGEEIQAAEVTASQERQPFQVRITELRQSYASVLAHRQAERDLRQYALSDSLDAAMVAAVTKKEVAARIPPLTGLALANYQILSRSR